MQKSNIDPKWVQAFVRVVRAGSFSESARREHCAPSSESRQIKSLEEGLGVRLLQRTTRRLSLTEAGKALFDKASGLFDEFEVAFEAVTQFTAVIRGRLRVTTPPAFGLRYIAPLIPEFLQTYPEIQIDIALQDRFVDVIGEGFDLAIRAGHLSSGSMIAKRLATNERILCASSSYLVKAGLPSRPRDLGEHNCLVFRYVDSRNEWRFRQGSREQSVPIRGNLESNNGDLLLQAVEGGVGIALLPGWLAADSLRKGKCIRVMKNYQITATNFDSSIYALYESRRYRPLKIETFLKFLQEKLKIHSFQK